MNNKKAIQKVNNNKSVQKLTEDSVLLKRGLNDLELLLHTSIEFQILGDNKSLGQIIFDSVPLSKHGIPQIKASFDFDKKGVLNVRAVDKVSGRMQTIRIEAYSKKI